MERRCVFPKRQSDVTRDMQIALSETLARADRSTIESSRRHASPRVAQTFFRYDDKLKSHGAFFESERRVRHGGAEQLFVNRGGCLAGRKGLRSSTSLSSVAGWQQQLAVDLWRALFPPRAKFSLNFRGKRHSLLPDGYPCVSENFTC